MLIQGKCCFTPDYCNSGTVAQLRKTDLELNVDELCDCLCSIKQLLCDCIKYLDFRFVLRENLGEPRTGLPDKTLSLIPNLEAYSPKFSITIVLCRGHYFQFLFCFFPQTHLIAEVKCQLFRILRLGSSTVSVIKGAAISYGRSRTEGKVLCAFIKSSPTICLSQIFCTPPKENSKPRLTLRYMFLYCPCVQKLFCYPA